MTNTERLVATVAGTIGAAAAVVAAQSDGVVAIVAAAIAAGASYLTGYAIPNATSRAARVAAEVADAGAA